ncbi:unnamed protein product [Arctogadus glacialis]
MCGRLLGGQRAQPDPGAEQTGPGPEVETSREEYGSEEQGQKEKALLGTGRGAVTAPTYALPRQAEQHEPHQPPPTLCVFLAPQRIQSWLDLGRGVERR